jgi:hypothetical protein
MNWMLHIVLVAVWMHSSGGAVPAAPVTAQPAWTSAEHYRVLLTVDTRGQKRSNSPASVDLDFQRALAELGASGKFDENTVKVEAVRDVSMKGHGILPHRLDKCFGTTKATLSFVVPDETCANYAVYFDTAESRRGEPRRYHGLIGDGDRFCEGFQRRQVAASHFDQFCDLDGDGDLDLFKGGVEPFIYCYENVGGNRLVERGRLASSGSLLVLPHNEGANRSWVTVAFYDWDGDGDQDFFPSFGDGPDRGKIVFYENVTREHGGQLTYLRRGPFQTVSGVLLAGGAQAGGWFPSIAFVGDWDGEGDGRTDVLVGSNHRCWLYRNLGPEAGGLPRLADAVSIQAGGTDLVLSNPRFDCADIDGDGDLDLFAGTQSGPVYWFKNIGARSRPAFDSGVIVAWGGKYLIGDAHSGIKVADFDSDCLLDFVAGRFWERTDLAKARQPRDYGGFYGNIGRRTEPRFEKRREGSPYTEQFQICDAVRQNCVRVADWNQDGKLDLLAGDTDGFIWFFQNQSQGPFSVFSLGQKLLAGGKLLSVANSGGHARLATCDWNNDGKTDLLVADGHGTLTLFLNHGSRSKPALAAGQKVKAEGKPIQIGGRASVLVADWNSDGKADVLLADEKGYYFCQNSGTEFGPVLAPPKAITFNGLPVGYARPNLGAFVDWDGDGKPDLIGCHFENSIRFYRNVGSGAPNQEPQFSDPEGVAIVQPWTVQMISGAEVIDWNGDGDLDILTGQGHGGSGLRFFERDWIEDELHHTHPLVRILGVEAKP